MGYVVSHLWPILDGSIGAATGVIVSLILRSVLGLRADINTLVTNVAVITNHQLDQDRRIDDLVHVPRPRSLLPWAT